MQHSYRSIMLCTYFTIRSFGFLFLRNIIIHLFSGQFIPPCNRIINSSKIFCSNIRLASIRISVLNVFEIVTFCISFTATIQVHQMTFPLEFLKDVRHAFRFIFSDMNVYFKMSVSSRNVALHI